MKSLKILSLLFVLGIAQVSFAEEKSANVETIPAEGLGVDIKSAAQNAAENALKQIVGSFIDSNTLLEKRTLIDNGIKSETKSISSDIKEYSQGSIKSFETVEVKQEGGLYKVIAKVSVRKENFSVYVKKLASGTTQIDGVGMFANISTKENQLNNLTSIVYDKITTPIISGEVIEFKIGKPILLSDFAQNPPDWYKDSILSHKQLSQNIIIFNVKTYLNQAFSKNVDDTLKQIATKHEVLNLSEQYRCEKGKFCIKKQRNSESEICDFFTLNFNEKDYKKFEYPNLNVVILDKNDQEIFIKSLPPKIHLSGSTIIPVNYSYDNNFRHFDGGNNLDSAWELLRNEGYLAQNTKVILDSMDFFVILELSPEVLSKANKIVISLGTYSNHNTIFSESKSTSQNSEMPSSTSVSSTSGNDVTSTANLKTDKPIEKPKSEKSPKQLQALKTNAVSDVKKKVSDNWSSLIKSADFSVLNQDVVSKFKCAVVATLSSNGDVTNVNLKESSGYAGFDSIAENAVKKSSPLPIAKNDELFDSSFKTMTLIFDKNNVEVQPLN